MLKFFREESERKKKKRKEKLKGPYSYLHFFVLATRMALFVPIPMFTIRAYHIRESLLFYLRISPRL